MKVKINQKDIVKLVNISQRAVSSRNPMQILDGILFIARDNILKLISTDMDMRIETKTECTVEESGEIVINSNLFGDIVKKLPDGMVTITSNRNNVEIVCGKAQFFLSGVDSDEFPLSPSMEDGNSMILKNSELKKAVRETEFATSVDVTRPHLNGIFLEKHDKKLKFVAIDGYRLAISTLDVPEELDLEIIVQKKALAEITKIIDDESETKITKSKSYILFENADTKLYSKLIEKSYIDYKVILSQEVNTVVKVDRHDLLSAFERASLILREGRVNLVKLSIADETINVSSNSELGNSKEDIECIIEGPGLNIAFNARYVIDGLKAIDEDNIELHCNNSLDPMEIIPEGKDDYLYLVLPVRVGR